MVEPNPPIVFVDSSALMAASISANGSARDLLITAALGVISLIISTLVLQETERNLRRKAPRALPAFAILRDLLRSRIVDPPEALTQEVSEIIDPKDAKIVAAAIHGKATFLVTYDQRHLLSEADRVFERYGVRIVRPDVVFAERLDELPSDE